MPAEYIPIGFDPELRMIEPLRRKFWPEASRELPSTLYLFCCYLAYRQHVFGIDALAIRHSSVPYAFCPDGRPYAEYQSPFLPNLKSFVVPRWYMDKYGVATTNKDVFVQVFDKLPCLDVMRSDPRLAKIAEALSAFDAATRSAGNRNEKKERVRDAHLLFFEASQTYHYEEQLLRVGYAVARDRFHDHEQVFIRFD